MKPLKRSLTCRHLHNTTDVGLKLVTQKHQLENTNHQIEIFKYCHGQDRFCAKYFLSVFSNHLHLI